MIISCRAVLFDMDGVLVDSTRAVARVWKQWAAEHGFDPERVANLAQGRPSITTIRDLLPNADHEAENRIVERREVEDMNDVVAGVGAKELLASLPADRWMVVTSSTRTLAEARLRAAGIAKPANIITSSDIKIGKPDPEPYLKAAAKLGVDPAEALVVEDSPAGIQSGKSAGCRVLALRTTMPEEVLVAAKPDWIVNNLSALRLLDAEESGTLRIQIRN